MTWDHPRAYDCLVAATADYANQTSTDVHWEKRSLQAFADVPIETLAREYDLIVLDHPHVGQIAESGCLVPLPDMPSEVSLGGSVECYKWQGRSWAWPIDAACQMAVTRPDLSREFPKTWEQILYGDAKHFGLLTPLLPVDAFDMMLTLVASHGEEYLPLSPSEFCSEANGILALTILKRLFKLGPSEAVAMNPIKVLEALSTSDDFAASPCLFGYINYARPDFRPHRLRYVDLPVFAGVGARRAILGGAGIGVSALRGNAETAQAFAAWVTSEPIQGGVYLHNQGQPAHLGAWLANRRDPSFAGFMDGGFETIRTAWTRPRDAWFLLFVDDVCEVITDFFLKDQDEFAFLAQLNQLYCKHTTKAAE
ncbi:hypothetical protein P9A16_27775 [Shinella sp. 838]|uniref:hypothetical protein n=1 Tax=Shinella sp. 838 TaxID=3038164 RepID=UPI0024157454|nr:hypothetical protein [Shinella sp. 838]MDG4674926.1 hypothetical protein [Shinella sp. 838]